MTITYRTNFRVMAPDVADLFASSGIRRPIEDLDRIQQMLDNANLTITAWDGDQLVGIGRALTDFSFCCYLSDLAVSAQYQRQGIGKEIIRLIKETIGEKVMLLLLSAPEAMEYYPHIGFELVKNAWIIPRSQ